MTRIKISDIDVSQDRKRRIIYERVVELAESISKIGLLQPIVVTKSNVLIAGMHRLEAHKHLGLETVETCVVSLKELDAELAEIDENLIRVELTVLERAEHLKRRKEIYEARYPETRTGVAGGKARQGTATEIISFARDTAKKIGQSARNVRYEVQIATVLSPAERDEIRGTKLEDSKVDLIELVREKDAETRKGFVSAVVSGTARSIREAKAHQKQKAKRLLGEELDLKPVPPPDGIFDVIVIDPPWRYEKRSEDLTHRGRVQYPDMSIDEIRELDVGKKAADNCVLWLWTTNAFMHEAYHCLESWGFEAKTVLTWVKDRIGLGDWLRGQSEHCIMAVRGKPVVTLTNQATILIGSARQHSRKPEEFYSLVDTLCHGSKLEMFSREQRSGWVAWGAETDKF